jgi:RNA polymerase sigma-70 factor, ECF subfamily
VRELISADARLGVADRFAGKFADAPYFSNYNRWPSKLAAGEVDGEPVVVTLRRGASYSVIRVNVTQKIERIADYIHCPW